MATRRSKNQKSSAAPGPALRISSTALLVIITLLGGALRTWRPSIAPAGMHPDEAAIIWNAWTLARTGLDQHGVAWPLVVAEGFGQSLTTAQLYLLVPVVRIFGTSLIACRLFIAILSTLAIPLIFVIGRAFGGDRAGLGAAYLLAVCPWNVQLSRWAQESASVTFLVLAAVATAHVAGLPIGRSGRRASPLLASAAGLLFGFACYGYLALRLWVPVFLATWFAARLSELREPSMRRAAIAFSFVFLISYAPIAADFVGSGPSRKRAETLWVWEPDDSLAAKAEKSLARYPDHFSWRFLFAEGDRHPVHAPLAGWGLFPIWASLPMAVGFVSAARRFRLQPEMRALVLGVLVYPAADLVSRHPLGDAGGSHLFRASPGLWLLVLTGGVGIGVIADWAERQPRGVRTTLALGAFSILAFSAVQFARGYFKHFDGGERSEQFQVTLIRAIEEVSARAKDYDAVVITGTDTWHAAELALVLTQYPAERWSAGDRYVEKGPLPNGSYKGLYVCLAFDKYHVLAGDAHDPGYERLLTNGREDRALFIIRPEELPTIRAAGTPQVVAGPNGEDSFYIVEGVL